MGMSIDDKLKAIIIPSGGSVKEDLQRASTAISYSRSELPYIIAGLGAETNDLLNTKNPKLDYNKELHDYLLNETTQKIGIDINSTNSVENIKYTFPKGTSGKYAIVSYPLHLKRFKLIFEDLKEKGDISQDLKLIYLPTSESLKQKLYGKLALFKQEKMNDKNWSQKFPLKILKRIIKG